MPASIDLVKERIEAQTQKIERISQISQKSQKSKENADPPETNSQQENPTDIGKSEISKLKFIGKIGPAMIFVCCLRNRLFLCNQARVKERTVYQDMCEKFCPTDNWTVLETPLKISKSTLKSIDITEQNIQKCWDILRDLVKKRNLDFLKNNGFSLVLQSKQLLLLEVFSKIPDYGIIDLVELLILISKHGTQKSVRPRKLKKYILETTREFCETLNLDNMEDSELMELLHQCKRLTCPHGHPVFEQICDISVLETEIYHPAFGSQSSQNT